MNTIRDCVWKFEGRTTEIIIVTEMKVIKCKDFRIAPLHNKQIQRQKNAYIIGETYALIILPVGL